MRFQPAGAVRHQKSGEQCWHPAGDLPEDGLPQSCIKYGFADRKGTIEVGKDADLVVISDDYQAQVTYAEGRKVYDRSTEGKIFNADYLNR